MISFDIFDTLITRKTLSPKGVFLIMQNKMKKINDYPTYVVNNFSSLRVQAETNARQYYTDDLKEDISLVEIYQSLQKMTGIALDLCQKLMHMEVDIECSYIVGIEKNIKKLLEYQKQGKRIVLISDMYLEVEDIRKILIDVHPVFKEIPIYVSSFFGKTKMSGALFIKVSELEQVSYNEWTHYGDNAISDGKIPELLGIKAVICKQEILNAWEIDFLNKNCLEESLEAELYFGASKILHTNSSFGEIEKMGASLGGIILYPYISWILYMCQMKKIKRLYFIARDGYVLKQIADQIISNAFFDIQITYIYGSRRAWRLEDEDSDEKKEVLRSYLMQEIDFTDKEFALVDLHGTGKTIFYLQKLLDDLYQGPWNVFYYDLVGKANTGKCNFMSFSSDTKGFIEIFARAPHGVTKGYEQREHHIVPILDKENEEGLKKSGLQKYANGVAMFSKEMTRILNIDNIYMGNDLSFRLLKYCQNSPHSSIVELLSEIPHSDNSKESNMYAPKLGKRDLFHIFMWNTDQKESTGYQGTNLDYSLRRLSKKDKRKVEFYKKHDSSIYGKLIHRWKSVKEHGWNLPGQHKKVVIYGAGIAGTKLYNNIKYNTNCIIVGWTDINIESYQKQGKPVVEPSVVLGCEFDLCVIAISKKSTLLGVKHLLMEMGVSGEKIVDRDEFYDWIDQSNFIGEE